MLKKLLVTIFILHGILNCAYATKLYSYRDKKTELYGFKNRNGRIIIPASLQSIGNIEKGEDLIPVFKNGVFYRMDNRGNLKFQSLFYDNGWDYYEENLARFIKNDKVGFHDKKGDIIINPDYDFATSFRNGVSIVCNGCWNYYPENPKYKPASSSGRYNMIHEQYMDIIGGKWGAIDLAGKIIVPIEYNSNEQVHKKLLRLK